jgi:hypothetical protein
MVDISDGIQFRRDGVNPSQWPILSCSQANQLALEVGDLRLDANREIFLQGNGQLRSSEDMLFLTGGSSPEKLKILADGNIGIGTSTPSTKLEVNGTVKASSFQGDGSTLEGLVRTTGDTMTGSLTIQNNLTVSGNVGIGNNLSVTPGRLSFGAQTRQMLNLWNEDYGIGVQSGTQYFRSNSDFAWFKGGNHNDARQNPGGGARLMALNSAGDLILSARTNPTADSTKSMCRALVDLDNKLVINFANDFSNGVEVGSGLKINGDFTIPNTGGGIARLTNQKYNNEAGFKNNNVKLSLASTGIFFMPNQPPLEYEFLVGHTSQVWISNPGGGLGFASNFVKKFSINQNGDAYFAGAKTGFVADYFVNRVGDTLEQGDVVVISQYQVSHYSGTENNIPILEVDLTETAYDSHVCGIVAKFVTEQDLPFVELEQDAQILPKDVAPEAMQEATESTEPYVHPFKPFAATLQESTDPHKIQDRQMGMMVTLGAFAHCKVDADIVPIKVGDLLTTSPTKGHAQKVLEPERAVGAIIGKALASLEKGKGKIPVLVMLQ